MSFDIMWHHFLSGFGVELVWDVSFFKLKFLNMVNIWQGKYNIFVTVSKSKIQLER
jgi:hypothetical protein